MKTPIATLICILVVMGCSKDKSAKEHFALSDVIPTGRTAVQILEVRYSERAEELSLKMGMAVAANQEWMMDYLKKHVDERPLPYHPNFGLSATEYTEYLEAAEKTAHLRKAADAYVEFRREGDLLTMEIGDPVVDKWSLNLSSGELLSPSGNAGKPEWQSRGATNAVLGAHDGYYWYHENGDAMSGSFKLVSLSIFRLKPSGMIFWRVKDSEMQNNKSVRSFNIAFQYEPKRARLGRK
jgi:hypothetical protein